MERCNDLFRKLSAGRIGRYSGFFPPGVLLEFARYCAERVREHTRIAQRYQDAAELAKRVAILRLRQMERAVERRASYSLMCCLACEIADAAATAALFSGEQVDWERAYNEHRTQSAWLEKVMMG